MKVFAVHSHNQKRTYVRGLTIRTMELAIVLMDIFQQSA